MDYFFLAWLFLPFVSMVFQMVWAGMSENCVPQDGHWHGLLGRALFWISIFVFPLVNFLIAGVSYT